MAASRKEVKLVSLLSLLFLIFPNSLISPRFPCLLLASEVPPPSVSNSVIGTGNRDEKGSRNPNFPQQIELDKLEELVSNLTQLVARLESRLAAGLRFSSPNAEIRVSDSGENGGDGPLGVTEGGGRAVLVAKYSSFWSERFQFVSAVKFRSPPTCIDVLPFRDSEGLSKYFAVGDDMGKLYVFLRSGDIAAAIDVFPAGEEPSPVTSMLSYLSVYKNESVVITGHGNGAVFMHRVWESSASDEWNSIYVERVGKFETPESGTSRIDMLEVHYLGRRRYILALDASGSLVVFREDGTLHGVTKPAKRPVAFMKQRLLFLTENGAASLELRTMKLKESECEGLNGSLVKTYVFDAVDRSKAYGFTADGDLIQTFLLGDTVNFKCLIRSKRKVDMDKPLALQAIKGYLLIANCEKIFVYNASAQHYVRAGGLRLLFSAGLDEIVTSFLNKRVVDDGKPTAAPLIVSDHEKHVIVSFGNGCVAMFRSNLPVLKNDFSSILWSSPVLFFILFLFAAWHFFANKKDALVAWGPNVSFSSGSSAGGAPNPLGPGTGDRSSFTDSSRSNEIAELRGGGLRQPLRYVSPPRYQGGAANSYRPGPDMDPVDPRYRPGSELKFRGANLEPAGVPMRRDALFGNSQVSDTGN